MTQSIEQYLRRRQKELQKLKPQPIIQRWLTSPRPQMRQALRIIDQQVADLLNQEAGGGLEKLDQWFLSGDKNFNALTAERYIIAYLKQNNQPLVDILRGNGVDAYLNDAADRVGIEITTLNGFIAEWILIERLTERLNEWTYLLENGLTITYAANRIQLEAQGDTIGEYIKQVATAIMTNDQQRLSKLKISVEADTNWRGIAWEVEEKDNYPWFRYLTDDLWSKLQEKSKRQQLQPYRRNLVFVGVNHVAPLNWAIPSIFEELGKNEQDQQTSIAELKTYWTVHMPSLTNVIGICFFLFDLTSTVPFYPLNMLWRSESDKIAIKL